MKQKLLFFVFLLLTCSVVRAAEMVACVVVEQTDGTKTEYLLSEKPKISYVDDVVRLTTGETYVDFAVRNVSRVYLSETMGAGIEDETIVSLDERTLSVQIAGGVLLMRGLSAGECVNVVCVNGTLAATFSSTVEGTLSVPLSELQDGLLIVKTGKGTFKFMNR